MRLTVSVIIAAYNASEFILRALASLETQTRRPDEVIVIDDGSVDGTFKCVQGFKQRSSLNIIIERQANKGLAATRNVGLQRSTGELVAFLDADDVVYPKFLEFTIDGLRRHKGWTACFSDRDIVDANGKLISKDLSHPKFQQIGKRKMGDGFVELADRDLFCKLVSGNLIPMTILFRRSGISFLGGFDEALRYGEDRYFLLGLIKRGGILGYVDTALGTWQRHGGNLTAPTNAIKNCGYIDMLLTKVLANRESWRLREPEVQSVLNARRAVAASWVYSASSSCSSSTLPLSFSLLVRRRISMACFWRAMGRYVLCTWRRRSAISEAGVL